jgi:hypothetical protein
MYHSIRLLHVSGPFVPNRATYCFDTAGGKIGRRGLDTVRVLCGGKREQTESDATE